MKKTEKDIRLKNINKAIAAILLLLIGGLAGYLAGYSRAQRAIFPEIKTVSDVNTGVAMVQLLEVKNGELKGRVGDKSIRLIYSPDGILNLENKNSFSVPLNQINLNKFFIQNALPEGALYIASKKGKYYYSILDKRSFSIIPQNRLYFGSAQEAESAGYKPNE